MNVHTNPPDLVADEMVKGPEEIAKFLTTLGASWTVRQVYHARTAGALPIRKLSGFGIYAFKSELVAALKAPKTLTPDHS